MVLYRGRLWEESLWNWPESYTLMRIKVDSSSNLRYNTCIRWTVERKTMIELIQAIPYFDVIVALVTIAVLLVIILMSDKQWLHLILQHIRTCLMYTMQCNSPIVLPSTQQRLSTMKHFKLGKTIAHIEYALRTMIPQICCGWNTFQNNGWLVFKPAL